MSVTHHGQNPLECMRNIGCHSGENLDCILQGYDTV
jgi:hypothetical protein